MAARHSDAEHAGGRDTLPSPGEGQNHPAVSLGSY